MIYKYLEEGICSMRGVYSEDSFSLKKLNGYRKRKPISRRSTSFLHTQHIPEHDNILPIDEGAFSCYNALIFP